MAPFFETGDDKLIKEAKREYRREYKRAWRKTKRSIAKEITTTWEKREFKILQEEAFRHRESLSGFIKKATMAYMDKRYVTPNEEQVTKTIQYLALVYNSMEELYTEGLIAKEIERILEVQISKLEHDIRVLLFSPKSIEKVIQEQIGSNPKMKERLVNYIQNLPV
jgi:hypothetical protein